MQWKCDEAGLFYVLDAPPYQVDMWCEPKGEWSARITGPSLEHVQHAPVWWQDAQAWCEREVAALGVRDIGTGPNQLDCMRMDDPGMKNRTSFPRGRDDNPSTWSHQLPIAGLWMVSVLTDFTNVHRYLRMLTVPPALFGYSSAGDRAVRQEAPLSRSGTAGKRGAGARHAMLARRSVQAVTLAATMLLAGCSDAPSVLDPQGPAAARIATLWWVMLTLALAIYALVIGLLLVGLFRGPRGQTTDAPRPPASNLWIGVGGIAMPAVVLIGLVAFTLYTERALLAASSTPQLTIEVIGKQWWWEVRYPDDNIVTANEIHIPTGQPVEIRLTSTDVIHSFWVPQLHGKLDLVPGRGNTIVVQADTPGAYTGLCAEFCGVQHALMKFTVVADTPDTFAAWVAQQQQPAVAPADETIQAGAHVFLSAGCISCHTIRGTEATGALGPDLTHLAARRSLAAGTLENNRGNLAGWILNPQSLKEGSKMPPTQLEPDDLLALVRYLESLN